MKAVKIEQDNKGNWLPVEYITCEVTGVMNSGEKVWTDIKTGEQYYCLRMLGRYMFYKE